MLRRLNRCAVLPPAPHLHGARLRLERPCSLPSQLPSVWRSRSAPGTARHGWAWGDEGLTVGVAGDAARLLETAVVQLQIEHVR